MSMESTCDQHRHSSSKSSGLSSCKNSEYGIRARSKAQCSNTSRTDTRIHRRQRNFAISSTNLDTSPCKKRFLGSNTFRRKTRTRNAVSVSTKSSKTKSHSTVRRLACLFQILFTIHHLQLFQTGNALLVDQAALEVGGSGATAVSGNNGGHYLDKFGNLERSVGAVLIKVAYGTTSTTKRSIPDNSYVPSLTTVATPQLTTLRYLEKSQHQQQINLHHRNYELDLERDHALPTSAPNADILKSNSNPTYPNPNRHHNHDRDRHRHILNSTPSPSIHNLSKKGSPTIPMYPGDIPSYSPPARSFFTPPLPPEYQNPFADKPTLRGTNNDAGIVNPGTYLNRRPLPPPSLTPGHERIPLRPPDLNGPGSNPNNGQSNYLDPDVRNNANNGINGGVPSSGVGLSSNTGKIYNEEGQRKKALNTPSQKINSKVDGNFDKNGYGNPNIGTSNVNVNETIPNAGLLHFPSISRILSGSNGRKEEIPEVLLRTVTVRPSNHPPSSPVKKLPSEGKNANINHSKNSDEHSFIGIDGTGIEMGKPKVPSDSNNNDNSDDQSSSEDVFDVFDEQGISEKGSDNEEPKTQPKIKMSTKSTANPNEENIYSTHVIHNLANINNEKSLLTTAIPNGGNGPGNTQGNTKETGETSPNNGVATWAVAWNIHVYLSAILFTILAVYSIFKMIFYDKLTHLFNQSYFICIHLILIIICMTRIFYLCYDAYNIHSSFHLFVSEILLNLPATFLTISFSVLILFLLIRSLNHKNNRYSALIRPLTVVVGSSVHVGLCITLHYVESYTTTHSHQMYYYQQQQQQMYRNGYRGVNSGLGGGYNHQLQPPPPPRVLSLICQIIYIFVCLSLGLLYLYIYRILKRVLRSKSQNYIHGYQNLSYAIHITIATALLYVLLAALQIYGAISISTTRPLITSSSEIDWLQWGYQFSLRLIEIAIITLMSWVAGLKTGGNSGALQREKAAETHNVSGFALFPCTSSSSQEHFETDYPAVCNANTNLHTYTLRTGKPIYDDNFALNSLGGGSNSGNSQNQNALPMASNNQRLPPPNNEFQIQNSNEFVRSYETSSLRSASATNPGHHHHNHHPPVPSQIHDGGLHPDFINDPQTDHYENPNFELRSNKQDNCYSEPLNAHEHHVGPMGGLSRYDFQNFERPVFANSGNVSAGVGGMVPPGSIERSNSRTELQMPKAGKQIMKSTGNHLDRSNYENPDRRSSNSTHSCNSGRNYPSYNSFERRSGVRKSGTLSNIGGVVHGRNGSSSSTSSSSRPSGVQTLSSTHNRTPTMNSQNSGRVVNVTGAKFYRDRDRNHRSSLERAGNAAVQQYMMQSDDDMPERANLIKSANNGSGSGITSSTSGNLTDGCMQQAHQVASSSSGDSATSGSMLVAEHGFVRFRALDDINNAQGVGIHNASIRANGRNKDKRFINNT